MSLLPRRARHAASFAMLASALALAGCGGGPQGPLLAGERPGDVVPESSRTRSDSLVRLGDTALRSGEVDTAATLFEQAGAIDRNNVGAAIGLGDSLLAAGRGLDASRAFERALALEPALSAAHYGYARAMIAIRRPEVAADHLRQLVKSDPSNVAAINALGVAYDLLGQHGEAAETYRQGLALMPASMQLRNNLGLSLALQEKFPEALELLRPLAEGAESTRRTRQNLALAYGLQGDLAGAERLGRVDLDGDALRANLTYFATVRGLADPLAKATALAPETVPEWDVPHHAAPRPRVPRSPAAVPSQPVPLPATPDSGPRPLTPAAGLVDAAPIPAGGWFVDIGRFPDEAAATARWQAMRTTHAAALGGLGKLAGSGEGPEPLLVGPLADEAGARQVCRTLGDAAPKCQPVQL